jgi:Raf kinase inhibitor-like YbhB/YbcL family protein
MLEKLPEAVGHALRRRRAGVERTMFHSAPRLLEADQVTMSSSAFVDGGRIPEKFTADGGELSPPLSWGDIPHFAASLAVIVEDADSPTSAPLVHAILVDIDPRTRGLGEGALDAGGDRSSGKPGRNSYLRAGWLPPDPPPGHGEHRYLFQLFALGAGTSFSGLPGRRELARQVRARAVGSGVLVGTYERAGTAPRPV